jgi:hypothetical protein
MPANVNAQRFDGFIVAESTLGFKRKLRMDAFAAFGCLWSSGSSARYTYLGISYFSENPTTLGASRLPWVQRCNQSLGNFRSAPTMGVHELVLLSCPWVVLLISNSNAEARICSAPLFQSWLIWNAKLQRAMDFLTVWPILSVEPRMLIML